MHKGAAQIRTFCILAHIDHGKSTLADRFLELTGAVPARQLRDQLLDDMDLERERGITIKAHPVTMYYDWKGTRYELNLLDTPGHVDFSYEVTRSVAACEGAILLVDATQGVEAQTVAHAHLAVSQGLVLVPALNKMDLPNADPERVLRQMEESLAIPAEEVLRVSAKTGEGVRALLERVIQQVPAPVSTRKELRALIFDSIYDDYRGAVAYVRVMDGELYPGQEILLMSSGKRYVVKEVGRFLPQPARTDRLRVGEVGYLVSNIRSASELRIGDTITDARTPASAPVPGFREMKPMLFASIYPAGGGDYDKLRSALEKLRLNDSALTAHPESSEAMGHGFRCGFLGRLHLEIVLERLRREHDVSLVVTRPNVAYRVQLASGEWITVDNPARWPEAHLIREVQEPVVSFLILCPRSALGDVMRLIREKRGSVASTETLDQERLVLRGTMPLAELMTDFFDRLKSVGRGFTSLDYEITGYAPADLVRMDILVHGEAVDAFASIVPRASVQQRGRELCRLLKRYLPRQLFPVAIQAAVGRTIVARETLPALRKDVTAKCYGGDVTRKRKLLEKQKEGKRKMKMFGKVAIPQETFLKVVQAGRQD